MPKQRNAQKPDEMPKTIRELAECFIDAVNSDPELILLLNHFEAAEREKVAAQGAEARRVDALMCEERRLAERLEAVRCEIEAAAGKHTSGGEHGEDRSGPVEHLHPRGE
jgi:hypothetical protein